MNAKISAFIICVEAIMYLLDNLDDWAFHILIQVILNRNTWHDVKK